MQMIHNTDEASKRYNPNERSRIHKLFSITYTKWLQ